MGNKMQRNNQLLEVSELKLSGEFLLQISDEEELKPNSKWEQVYLVLENRCLSAYSKNSLTSTLDLSSGVQLSDNGREILLKCKSLTWKVKPPTLALFIEWNYAIKLSMRPVWQDSSACQSCNQSFSLLTRQHHCRRCGKAVCQRCSPYIASLKELAHSKPQRVCRTCAINLKRPSNFKELRSESLNFNAQPYQKYINSVPRANSFRYQNVLI